MSFDRGVIDGLPEQFLSALPGYMLLPRTVGNNQIRNVSADKIIAGSLTAGVTLGSGGKITGTGAGGRVEMDSAGIRLYDGSNNVVVDLKTADGTGSFIGTIRTGPSTSGNHILVSGGGLEMDFYEGTEDLLSNLKARILESSGLTLTYRPNGFSISKPSADLSLLGTSAVVSVNGTNVASHGRNGSLGIYATGGPISGGAEFYVTLLDLSDNTGALAITPFATTGGSLSSTGLVRMRDFLQAGTKDIALAGVNNGSAAVTFATAFAAAPFVVITCVNDDQITASAASITTTGFTAKVKDNVGVRTKTFTLHWVAVNASN